MTMNANPLVFGVGTLLGEEAAAFKLTAPLEMPIVAHGSVQRLASFMDIPALRDAAAVVDAWDGAEQTARAWSPVGGPAYEIFPTREQIRTLYDAGCTLVLEDVERFIPALRPFCRALERDLDIDVGRVNVEVFCARREGHSRPHFDPSFTFNCQIQGAKHWRLARHESVRFPPTGMFLGRAPVPQLARTLSGPLPVAIEGGTEIIAEPGTVVFLPPGVLHETHTEKGSYAIAFAIEHVDTLGGLVLETVRNRLLSVPILRAARLGAQFREVQDEATLASEVLRRIADEIDAGDWRKPEVRFRLKVGLTVESTGGNRVILRSSNVERTLLLDQIPSKLLVFASGRRTFTARDIGLNLPTLDPETTESCLELLMHRGLVEHVGPGEEPGAET
jgi:hypothetical protein